MDAARPREQQTGDREGASICDSRTYATSSGDSEVAVHFRVSNHTDVPRNDLSPFGHDIDCHEHDTTAPKPLQDFRDKQVARLKDPSHIPAKGTLNISDDQIRESLEGPDCCSRPASLEAHCPACSGSNTPCLAMANDS